LWRNLMSSQPLAFSIAGHLRAHRPSAARLLRALTDHPISALATLESRPRTAGAADYHLDSVEAEWFPPREHHTNDMSGCDIACCASLEDGRRMLVTVEVKYTDSFSPEPIRFQRYEPHLQALGLDARSTEELVTAGCSQVLRQVLITDSVRRSGLAPGADASGRVGVAMAVVLARHDDQSARRVVDVLDAAVGDRMPIRFWSHRDLLTAAEDQQDLRGWATDMEKRYVVI